MSTIVKVLLFLLGLVKLLGGRGRWERALKKLQEQLDETSKQYLAAISRGDAGAEWQLRVEQTDRAVAIDRHKQRGVRAGYIRGAK